MNMTTEQTSAILKAISLYQDRIHRIAEHQANDLAYSEYKTSKGLPTAEAMRAQARVESANRLINALNAELVALRTAFGIQA